MHHQFTIQSTRLASDKRYALDTSCPTCRLCTPHIFRSAVHTFTLPHLTHHHACCALTVPDVLQICGYA